MKKKFLWLTLSLLLLTGCAAPAEPEQSEQPKETGYVQQHSDAVALCREELSVGLNALTELDTQLLGGAQTKEGGYTLAVWQLRCGEQALLLWRLDCAAAKENPGALDAIHLTWDGADYDRSEGDGVYSTVRGRDSKSVSFNVDQCGKQRNTDKHKRNDHKEKSQISLEFAAFQYTFFKIQT